ncbi:MAG: PHP domain-containing protein [Spirochaetaceae bacterium]|jgi:putative hydrolase|nr:PHP domain-containing protein [Spirochaetaceae bacterium]
MRISVDTHTHSIASGHAYSTLDELAAAARKRRLKGFVLTEHGPALQGFPHEYYFGNLHILPKMIHKVRVFRGVELNIMDRRGGVDLSQKHLRNLDFVMAGFHEACYPPQNSEENTQALIAVLANPFVDGISHPGNPAYPVDIEAIVKSAVRYGKTLEINNSSFKVRRGCEENCRSIAHYARLYGALLTCGSDAHYAGDIGNFERACKVIIDEGIHPEQVVNSTFNQFLQFCARRKAERLAVA